MHTTWMREHNYWARRIRQESKKFLTDEEIYQRARSIVSSEIEAITYNEFLPVLLGPTAIPAYTGYHPDVNPNISVVFSTASYRMGHTLLTHILNRLDSSLQPLPGEGLTLQKAFFNPKAVFNSGGIEPFLRGAAHQHANAYDAFIVDDVRNFLINDPQPGSFDLASLNIQRGRDLGIPPYNDLRVAYGLTPKADFSGITPGAVVGELARTVIAEQFTRSRDGDRFFYANVFSPQWVEYFNKLHFSDVILRNTTIGKKEIQKNVFLAQ